MLHVHCCRCLCRPLISLKYLRKWWFCQSLEWNWETHSASLQTNFSYCPKNVMNQLQVTFALAVKSISIKQHYNVVGCLFNLNCLPSFCSYRLTELSHHGKHILQFMTQVGKQITCNKHCTQISFKWLPLTHPQSTLTIFFLKQW